MRKDLKAKALALQKIRNRYTEVLKIGAGKYGIAALCRIGMAYQEFAKALFAAPIPPNLTEDQREIYTAELQNQAFPIEEKAIEAYEKSVAKSFELGVYSKWTLKAQELLTTYQPGLYGEIRDVPLSISEAIHVEPPLKSM